MADGDGDLMKLSELLEEALRSGRQITTAEAVIGIKALSLVGKGKKVEARKADISELLQLIRGGQKYMAANAVEVWTFHNVAGKADQATLKKIEQITNLWAAL